MPGRTATARPAGERATITTATPVLRAIHTDGIDQWSVAASWPDGRREEITGFKNETEANEWIATKFDIWLQELELTRNG